MMISRRNFFSITIMMFVVFFLFLFSGAAKLALSNYQINEYAKVMHREVDAFEVNESEDTAEGITGDFAFFIGNNGEIKSMVREWCRYNQYDLVSVTPGSVTVGEDDTIDSILEGEPVYVMIDGASITSREAELLDLCDREGIPMIFCSLPSPGYLSANSSVANMLGITNIQSSAARIQGMHLYSGFLLGGEYVYEVDDEDEIKDNDLQETVPWVILASASKVYMDGILDEKSYTDVDAAYKPPIIWRYNTGSDYVFAVNADFMGDPTALGILSGIRAELNEVTIYPIVNAQNFVINNYPSFTDENEKKMREIYSRDSEAVLRDLIWPGLVSIRERTEVVPSLMFSAKLDYSTKEEPGTDNLDYFLQLMREQRTEAGLGLVPVDGSDPEEKLTYDLNFFEGEIPDYEFQMAYIGDIEPTEARRILDDAGQGHIATLLRDYSDDQEIIIGYEEGYSVISTVNTGTSHTYREDLLMRSIETALGYSVISEDLGRVIYPDSADDHWQVVYKALSGNTNNYWKPFETFAQTTISEAGDRARMYLDLKYEIELGNETASIATNLKDLDDVAYFMLRAPKKEVTYVSGGTFYEIEDGSYLIELHKETATVYYRDVKESQTRRVISQEQAR